MSVLNQHILTLSLTCAATLGLAIFVLLQPIRKIIKWTFALYSLSICLWSAGQAYALYETNVTFSLISVRLCHIGVIFIPVFFIHFLLRFLERPKNSKAAIYFIYGIGLFFLFFIPTRGIVKDVSLHPPHFMYVYNPGYLYPLLVAFWFLSVSCGLYLLFTSFIKSSGLKRNQLKYLFFGTLLGYLGGVSNFLFAYDVYIRIYMPYGTCAISLYVAIFAYAIVKYRLMDIRVAVTRAGIFFSIYVVVLGLPFALGYKLIGKGYWGLSLLVMAVFATAGPFIYGYLQRKAEGRLRKEEFDAHKALNRLTQNMMRFTKLEALLNLVVHHVVKIMKVYSATIYLKDESNGIYHLRATWGIDTVSPEQSEFLEDSPLIKDILLRKVPILSEELKFSHTHVASPHKKKLLFELDRANVAALIPAFKADSLFGFLMLGARRDKRIFSQEDLSLLLLLANQAVLAVENAQLFEREKTLMAEKSRRDALADMAPGVAHQFNNRLAVIINTADAQILLNEVEGDLNKLTQDKLVSIIENSQKTMQAMQKEAVRGRDIANAILMKGRANLNYIEADLSPVIHSAIELFKVSRTRKSLDGADEPDIIFEPGKDLPRLILNESLMQDIFYNLLDNARDAIVMKHRDIVNNKIAANELPYKGKITITVQKQSKSIVVSVSDNGIGMDEKSKKRLFVPYFTTKATSLKGTGMGLWVIRSFIEDHKGRISFESEYAKGTTFTITFPVRG